MPRKSSTDNFPDASGETAANRERRKREPTKVVVTFDILDEAGNAIVLAPGQRVVVRSVERNMLKFAEAVLDNPASVGMFAKIEVPSAG